MRPYFVILKIAKNKKSILSHFENSQEQKINTEDGVDPTPARMGCQHFWRHQCSREFVLSVIFLSLFIVAARRSAFITAGVSGRRFNARCRVWEKSVSRRSDG